MRGIFAGACWAERCWGATNRVARPAKRTLRRLTRSPNGRSFGGDRHPKVRDGVLPCAGAKVLGNVEIGRDAKVGAGSVVLHDVPPRATVAGVPARIVGWSSGSVPALEMDQSLPDYEI